MVALRIFSYLPNPRIWKATITARLCDVEVEVRGASPNKLSQWLWDFDARPIADVPREMLASAEPLRYCAFSPCFRAEAGAARQGHPRAHPPAPIPQGRAGEVLP